MAVPSRLFATRPAPRARADAFLTRQLAERVAERLQALSVPPRRLAVLGALQPLADALQDALPTTELVQSQIDPVTEALQVDGGFNALADIGTLATVNDLPGVLHQVRARLSPGGVFVSALFGGESLKELRLALIAAEAQLAGGAAPRLHPLLTAEAGLQLLQRAGFTDPVSDRETLRLTYPDLPALAADLRAANLTNRLAERAARTPRGLFTAAEAQWRAQYPAPADRLALTLEIVALTGWTQPAAAS